VVNKLKLSTINYINQFIYLLGLFRKNQLTTFGDSASAQKNINTGLTRWRRQLPYTEYASFYREALENVNIINK